jgi:DNA-binding Lrp family transcriptional regulator
MPERRASMRPRPCTHREAIIRFVSQPRAIGEIEAQVGRPGQNVASHLREMARLGYIKRVGPGIYAPRDYAGPMPEHWAIKPPRPGTQREAILRFVSQPRAIREVAEHLGYPAGTIKAQLTMLTRIGFLKRVGPGIYAPRDYAGPAASVARSKKKCKP